jgi:Flp pilus assembly protein TadD
MASSSQKSAVSATPTLDRIALQTQSDFELEFYAAILQRLPDHLEVLKAHAKNLAGNRRHEEGLIVDRQITKLRPTDALAHYNLACSFALTEHPDDAFVALRKAVELGYRDFRFMREDRDLDSIRKDPRFRAILREFDPRKTGL